MDAGLMPRRQGRRWIEPFIGQAVLVVVEMFFVRAHLPILFQALSWSMRRLSLARYDAAFQVNSSTRLWRARIALGPFRRSLSSGEDPPM